VEAFLAGRAVVDLPRALTAKREFDPVQINQAQPPVARLRRAKNEVTRKVGQGIHELIEVTTDQGFHKIAPVTDRLFIRGLDQQRTPGRAPLFGERPARRFEDIAGVDSRSDTAAASR